MADVQPQANAGPAVPPYRECDVCPRPAIYEGTTTHASGEQTKANLCLPHDGLALGYKQVRTPAQQRLQGKPHIAIDKDKKQEFLDLAKKPGGRELGELFCDPDRSEYKGRRLTRNEKMGIELAFGLDPLKKRPEPERGMSL